MFLRSEMKVQVAYPVYLSLDWCSFLPHPWMTHGLYRVLTLNPFLHPGPHRFSPVTCVVHLWFLLILGKGLPSFDEVLGLLNLISVTSLIAVSKSLPFQKTSLLIVLCKKAAMLYFTSAFITKWCVLLGPRCGKQEPPI